MAIPVAPPEELATPTSDRSRHRRILKILSFLVSLAGLVVGVIYIAKDDEFDRKTGEQCLIWAAIGFGFAIALNVLWLASF